MNNLANNIQYSLQHYAAMTQAQLLNATPSPQQQQQPLIQGINYPTLSLLRMTTPPQLHQPTIASPSSSSSSSSGKEDCNAPIRVTRPPNAYLLFNKKMRRILKDQDPTMNVGEISKQIADRWKKMTQEEKDIYIKEANRLKEEQRALHPNSMYIRRSRAELIEAGKINKEDDNNNISESDKKKRGKKRTKNPGIPKHPLSAYMWYLTEVRPKTMKKFPSSNVGQISKYCAEKWHSMTDEERAPWKTKAQVDKDRYAREMQLYAIQNDHELGRGTRQKYRHAIIAAAAAAAASTTPTVSTPSTASGNTTDCLLDSALFNKEYDPSLLISAPTSPSSILRANTSGQSHTSSLIHAPEDEFVNH